METVKAVPMGERLSLTISGRFSCRQRSSVSVRQIEAARVGGHEVDRLGRDEVGGEHEVALVLAVLGVGQHDHAAAAHLVDEFLGRVGLRFHGNSFRQDRYFATFRSSPGAGRST